jgi:hypothetical protein
LKDESKEKILKTAREKRHVANKGSMIPLMADFFFIKTNEDQKRERVEE